MHPKYSLPPTTPHYKILFSLSPWSAIKSYAFHWNNMLKITSGLHRKAGFKDGRRMDVALGWGPIPQRGCTLYKVRLFWGCESEQAAIKLSSPLSVMQNLLWRDVRPCEAVVTSLCWEPISQCFCLRSHYPLLFLPPHPIPWCIQSC